MTNLTLAGLHPPTSVCMCKKVEKATDIEDMDSLPIRKKKKKRGLGLIPLHLSGKVSQERFPPSSHKINTFKNRIIVTWLIAAH